MYTYVVAKYLETLLSTESLHIAGHLLTGLVYLCSYSTMVIASSEWMSITTFSSFAITSCRVPGGPADWVVMMVVGARFGAKLARSVGVMVLSTFVFCKVL